MDITALAIFCHNGHYVVATDDPQHFKIKRLDAR